MENHAMKILFVTKYTDHPIVHALTELGHTVTCADEAGAADTGASHDFALFTYWEDWTLLAPVEIPKVFWRFGFIDHSQDQALAEKSVARLNWMAKALALCDFGFSTDGDWVKRHPEKLAVLHAAADERLCGPGVVDATTQKEDGILFFGSKAGHGFKRWSFVTEMKLMYGGKFTHVENPQVRGRELASLIAGHAIVVAPDGPVTHAYWSDRVYIALGMGGFLVHPLCADLAWEYKGAGKDSLGELAYYKDRDGLHNAIKFYLAHPEDRKLIAERGYLRTMNQHTYTHRCARLVKIVEERVLKARKP